MQTLDDQLESQLGPIIADESSAQEEMKMKITIRFGDLIAALYDEAKKETKDKRMQSVLVGLAFHDLKLRYGISKKGIMMKKCSAA